MSSSSSTTSNASSPLTVELPKLFFACGEVVKGKVTFTPKSDKVIYGIHINFSGHEWCENGSLSDIPFQKRWILDGSTTVYGNKSVSSLRDGKPNYGTTNRNISENQGVVIKAGTYVWPFSFVIPKNIPPSCDYRNGKVRVNYTVSAIVDIPWSRSIKCVQNLRVGIPYFLDPNRQPNPVRVEKHFVFHKSGVSDSSRPHLLKLEGYVDKPVTYTGDKVGVYVKLDNNSGRTVHSVKCKLKQTWTYGSGFWEKFTVFKVKHKDSQFPLQQGKYSLMIPMIIPNLVARPTVQNASLIRCVYHVTLKLSFRIGGDLRARIPIIVASFPPAIRDTAKAKITTPIVKKKSKKPKAEKVEKKEPKKEKVEKTSPKSEEPKKQPNPVLLSWDDATPDQYGGALGLEPVYAAPLQPTAEELHDVGPSLNINDFMLDVPFPSSEEEEETQVMAAPAFSPDDLFMKEINFNRYIGEMNQMVNELENGIQWAAAGQLDQTMDTPVTLSSKTIQTDLKTAADLLNQSLNNVQNSVTGGEDLVNAVKDTAYNTTAVALSAKMAAINIGDINTQQMILQTAKTIPLTAQQAILLAKEASEQEYIDDSLLKLLADKVKGVNDATAALMNAVKQGYINSASSVQEITATQKRIDDALADFMNPYGTQANQNATLQDLELFTQNFASVTNKFVIACHGSNKDLIKNAQELGLASEALMRTSKGVASQHPSAAQAILESVRASIIANSKLLELAKTIASREQGSPSVSLEKSLNLNSSQILQQSTKVVSLIRGLTTQIKKEAAASRTDPVKTAEVTPASKPVQAVVTPAPVAEKPRHVEPTPVETAPAQQATVKKPRDILAMTQGVPLPAPIVQTTAVETVPAPKPTEAVISQAVPSTAQFAWLQQSGAAETAGVRPSASDELANALKAIQKATDRLRNMNSTNQGVASPAIKVRFAQKEKNKAAESLNEKVIMNYDHKTEVVAMSGSLAEAVSGLLSAAQVAQEDRGDESDPNNFYHADPTWSQGLTSAAKEVATLVQSLVRNAENKRTMDEDMVASLARAIAGSTAQLVSAARAKGDPESQSHKDLLNAAKGVARAVSDLVAKTQEVERPSHNVAEREAEKDINGLTATKIQELEAAVRIARLEKELNAARGELSNLRKDRYEPSTKNIL